MHHAVAAIFNLSLFFLSTTGCASRSISTPSCTVCNALLPFGEIEAPSDLQRFHHQGLDSHEDGYLVRIDEAAMTGGAKNQYRMSATILETIRGSRLPGSELEVLRVNDGPPEMVKSSLPDRLGQTVYVFLYTHSDGELKIDQQSPHTIWPSKREYRRIIALHKEFCLVSQR